MGAVPEAAGEPPESKPDERLTLALNEALRALTHQQGALDNLRSRATVLTASAALVISLFGGRALQSGVHGAATLLALFALFAVLATALVICVPIWTWRFRSSARSLIEARDAGFGLDDMRRHLAMDFESWLDQNQRRIDALQWCFVAGVLLLFVEISAWTVQMVEIAR